MDQFITDERTRLRYELIGDCYLIAGEDEPEGQEPIGVWGQLYLRHLKKNHHVLFFHLTSRKSNGFCWYALPR